MFWVKKWVWPATGLALAIYIVTIVVAVVARLQNLDLFWVALPVCLLCSAWLGYVVALKRLGKV